MRRVGSCCGGLPKSGILFWGPMNQDYNISETILGYPHFGKLPCRSPTCTLGFAKENSLTFQNQGFLHELVLSSKTQLRAWRIEQQSGQGNEKLATRTWQEQLGIACNF